MKGNAQEGIPPWGQREMPEAQRKQAKTALSRCLGSDHISTRQGPRNTKVPYLDVSTAIRLANDAFRYDGWASSITSIEQDFITEERGMWSCCYSATVRITLPNGCYHDGVGVGNAENVRHRADAIDKAKKSAVSDAMKRALRCFGEGLGNSITTDSINTRGSVRAMYEDEFIEREARERLGVSTASERASSRIPAASLVNSTVSALSMRTIVSPITTKQLEDNAGSVSKKGQSSPIRDETPKTNTVQLSFVAQHQGTTTAAVSVKNAAGMAAPTENPNPFMFQQLRTSKDTVKDVPSASSTAYSANSATPAIQQQQQQQQQSNETSIFTRSSAQKEARVVAVEPPIKNDQPTAVNTKSILFTKQSK